MSSTSQPLVRVPFGAHIALLETLLTHRSEIVERVEGLLNAQRRPPWYLQDVPLLARHLEECFFGVARLSPEETNLRHQLEEAHWASGFKPRETAGQHQDLVDPAEMMSRAFLMWQRIRWPGHHGRLRYAQTLFNVFLLRRLMLLAMRLWDAEWAGAGDRLAQVQRLLDELGRTTPQDQPVLVRDARWLFPLAQSPTTDELHGYFEVAKRIAETLPPEVRIEIHEASVRTAGGHLRSQLCHVATQKRVSLDEPTLILSTRRSNALDLATLIQSLVPLLDAYERAVQSGDAERRLTLADALCQGVSPDPELFLNRLDLLGPYSMIEHLFVTTDREGHAAYTAMGERHLRLVDEYRTRIARVSRPLYDDCLRFRPLAGGYSPYGLLYGYSSRLLEHMALKASQPEATTRFSLEDAFVAGDADKLAWVNGWRNLPHVPREVVRQFQYPQPFAEEVFRRIELALRRRAEDADVSGAALNGRLFVGPADRARAAPQETSVQDLPVQYVVSSDRQLIAERKATAYDEPQLLHSRNEGEFLVSYRTTGGWVALTKDILTEVVGAGRNANVTGLPREAAEVLKLMCPDFATA